ncbi:hypothetical protein ABW20_dc0108683 [Dactylellina cionopaga]|nr:hypothetical protein ABW20_dc0108683 [Dactylellina cionopaga]
MASAASGEAVPSEGTVSVRIKVMNPGSPEARMISEDISLSSTVGDLKQRIKSSTSASSDPDSHRLRLIYQGKQLADDTVLQEAFQNNSGGPVNLHLVVRPNPEGNTTTTIPARTLLQPQPGPSTSSSTPATLSRTPAPPPRYTGLSDRPASVPAAGPTQPPNRSAAPIAPPVGLPRGNILFTLSGHRTVVLIVHEILGIPPNAHIISYNRQVTITTTGHIFRRPQAGTPENQPQTAPSSSSEPGTANAVNTAFVHPENGLTGTQPTPQASRNNQTPAPSEQAFITVSNPSIHPSPASGMRTNRVPTRIVHMQTHTLRFTTQSRPDIPSPGVGPGIQGVYSAPHAFGLPQTSNFPGLTFPGTAPTQSMQQQYWLLQGPNGANSILLSPQPPPNYNNPWAFSPPRIRSPLAPIGSHLSPPPGLNLNDLASAGASEAELRQREAALDAEIQEIHQRNVQRMAAIDEHQRQILRLTAETQALVAAAQAPAAQPAVPAVAPPVVNQRQLFNQNPLNNVMDFLLWIVGGANPNIAGPSQQMIEDCLRWIMNNIWLAIRLVVAVYLLGGGRDFRRDAVLWIAVTVIFIWQSGIFDTWLRPLIGRLNDMIPDPNRPVNQPQQPQAEPAPGAQPAARNPIPDVQQMAQRLLEQHNDRQAGGVLNAIQTSVGIFLASLIPGLGERIGNARAAERERRLQVLEEVRAAALAAQAEQDGPGEANAAAAAAPAPEENAANQPPAQAPGPQNADVVNAARDHFGDQRAAELFGPQGEQNGADGDVQALFGF